MRTARLPIQRANREATRPRWPRCVCIGALAALALGCSAPFAASAKGRRDATAGTAQLAQQLAATARSTPPEIESRIKRLPPVPSESSTHVDPAVRPASALVEPGDETKRDDELPAPLPQLSKRLKIPDALPGAAAPPIQVPPLEDTSPTRRNHIIDELFPNRPPLANLAAPAAAPMTLSQVESLALANNPELVQAMADITSAQGDTMQAGVHPNPTIGYEADTVGSFGTRNYQGVYGTQLIKTAGKLGLQRAVANIDLMNAQLALRKTRIDVLSRVKARYYAVLVAQQNVIITSALVSFTNEAYRIQVEKLKAGDATAYEPAQLRTLDVQARAAEVQARMRYISAWKQLAALVGVPDLPVSELEGRVDAPLGPISYDEMLARILNNHPDLLAARNSVSQAQLQLQLQRTIPIPDVQMYGTFQKDFTTPGTPRTVYNVQFGLPVPLWDRNRGNIMSAEGDLRRASEQVRRTTNDLNIAAADAFERFETNRVLSQYLREQVLPDQARVYRGVYERHQQQPEEVGFGDIIVAQQNLAIAIGTYIGALNAQWTALADIANLMQEEDLSQLRVNSGAAVPELKIVP